MLDGKYEITSERELGQVTLFGATAPDGTALTISWYDLATPADEHAFEQYRTLLRQLKRGGHAAVYDLVSRPGAHYVAWRLPGEVGALPVGAEAELGALEAVLSAHHRSLSEAHICAPPGAPPRIYALDFAARKEPNAPIFPTSAPAVPKPQTSGSRWLRVGAAVWQQVRPWTPAGLLGLLGVLLLLLSLERLVQSELVSVPAVQGQEINAALSRLQKAGFRSVPVALTSNRPAGRCSRCAQQQGRRSARAVPSVFVTPSLPEALPKRRPTWSVLR